MMLPIMWTTFPRARERARTRKREEERDWRDGILSRAERDGLEGYARKFARRFHMYDVSVDKRLGPLTGR